VQECGELDTVCPGKTRFAGLPLQDGELVAQVRISMSLSVSLIGSSRINVNTLESAR
jgi:hypothetical protein